MGSLVLGDDGEVGRAPARVPTPRWMNATTSQGVSRPEEEMDFLPFTVATLGDAEIGGGVAPTGVLLGKPQRPFRGERLIMGAVDSDAVDVASNVVVSPALYVGAVQVGAAQGSTPITAFSPNAFGVRLSMPAAGQGTEVKIFLAQIVVSQLVQTVTAVLIGRAMR